MKAEVDKCKCIGCKLCVELSEDVFVMDEDGKAKVAFNPIPPIKEQYAKEAEYACPVDAIKVII
ncbi:ferredoxin [Clostridium oceanicum]|uniref:Ferredoxin n=1 Tax=Clostridium oceanicum TaxID=1543 RepID=A0ABP3UX26_9CLOT